MVKYLKIPQDLIFGRNTPCGEVRLDTAIRLGRHKLLGNRPVIATFTTRSGRNIVNSRIYTRLLINPIRIRIAEHFPTITKEKRYIQIKDHLKPLRDTHAESTTRVTLNKDKILLNGVHHDTYAFERNPLASMSPLSINYEKLAHSEEITEKKSVFQGHALPVQTLNQAIAAKNSIFQNPDLAQATHIIYAYTIGEDRENIESGFFDDDEVGSGRMLMNLLQTEKKSNMFICVTRQKNGPNIGDVRFTHIKNSAKEALISKDLPEDPDFNHIIFN